MDAADRPPDAPRPEPAGDDRASGDGENAGEEAHPFWDRPETVEKFAGRDPDHRLVELVDRFEDPAATGVLDLGCAAGRNTVLLAREGFDVRALDTSPAMVERTRERVAEILGPAEAERRVRVGRMEELGDFPDGRFRLVVALGVYHQAQDREGRARALSETARVLEPGGLVLVAVFHPDSRPDGEPRPRVSEEAPLYEGFHSGVHYLVGPDELDREMAARGLRPAEPTETVRTETEEGVRMTINALYRKEEG